MIVMVNLNIMNIMEKMMKKCEELKQEIIAEILEKVRINYLDYQDKMLNSHQINIWKNSEVIYVYKNLLDYMHKELTEFPLEKLIYLRDDNVLDKLVKKHQKFYYEFSNRDFESLINNYVKDVKQAELSKNKEELI